MINSIRIKVLFINFRFIELFLNIAGFYEFFCGPIPFNSTHILVHGPKSFEDLRLEILLDP